MHALSTPSFVIDYRINNNRLTTQQQHRPVSVHATTDDIDQLVRSGFLLCHNMFDEQVLDRMRDAVDRIEQAETGHPNAEHVANNGFYLRYLRDKDEVFRDLMFFEPPLSIARAVLGPQVWFDADARIAYEGQEGKLVPWHIHKRVVPDPLPPFFAHPHGIHCLLYLDPVGEAEGALVVLPGSHLDNTINLPDGDTRDMPGQLLLYPQPGDCLIVHANLWHRTIPTTKDCRRRRLVLFGYEPSWTKSAVTRGVKPQQPLTADLRGTTNPEIRELLDEWTW